MHTSQPTKFHPITGFPVRPLGRRKDGRLIWPIMGGSEAAGGDAGGNGDGGDAGTGHGADAGGDAGKPDDGKPTDDGKNDSPWNDPTKAQAEIERLRRENAADRTKSKEDAAKEAREAMAKEIGKAIGLVDSDKAPTVDDLTKQLTEQTAATEQATAAHRDTQAELVVWRNATELGVDAGALTDSRAFAAAIKSLDPASDSFAADVKKAAQAAAETNPKLKATQAAGSSSADHGGTGGGTTSKTPQSLSAAVGGHYGT